MATPDTDPEEPAHDVLAAEAFAVPAPDPALHRGPVVLPDDPSGIAEPHDILAAEEFAMPAPRTGGALARHARSKGQLGLFAAGGALLALILFRLLRRRRA